MGYLISSQKKLQFSFTENQIVLLFLSNQEYIFSFYGYFKLVSTGKQMNIGIVPCKWENLCQFLFKSRKLKLFKEKESQLGISS